MKKRVLSLVLALTMVLGMVSALPVFAAEIVDSGTCGENITWTLDEEGTLTISGTGEMTSAPWTKGDVTKIKAVIIEKGITNICNGAFFMCEDIETVSIPDTVRTIGVSAFLYCRKITSIILPKGVTVIEDSAFSSCYNLLSLTIPDTVIEIGDFAFSNCNGLINIVIPDSVTKVGWSVFSLPSDKTIYYTGTPEQWEKIKDNLPNNFVIYISMANVVIDGKEITFDQPPIIENDRTLVPLRAIFEELGAEVSWDGASETVTATKDNTTISLTIGSDKMTVNNSVKILDVPAKIVNSRTLVPVRAISEAFNCKVDWDGETKTVIITTK